MAVLFSISACDDTTECSPPGGALDLQYIHDGHNAIFGQNAVVDRKDISFSVLNQPEKATDMWFVDSTMALRIFLVQEQTYILTLGLLRSDTFHMTESLEPRGRDCPVSIALAVTMNGELVCEYDCDKVIGLAL